MPQEPNLQDHLRLNGMSWKQLSKVFSVESLAVDLPNKAFLILNHRTIFSWVRSLLSCFDQSSYLGARRQEWRRRGPAEPWHQTEPPWSISWWAPGTCKHYMTRYCHVTCSLDAWRHDMWRGWHCTITRLITTNMSHWSRHSLSLYKTQTSSLRPLRCLADTWFSRRYWHPSVYDKETLCVVQNLTKKAKLCVCYWHGKWWFLGGQGKELTQPHPQR